VSEQIGGYVVDGDEVDRAFGSGAETSPDERNGEPHMRKGNPQGDYD